MARGEDWSRVEVEATVASYFDMLRLELELAPYNKAARRRDLQRLLDGRSEGSIERKHQNISAVLVDLGFPYIDGYKPLSNYQDLLRRVIEERLAAAPALVARVAEEVERDAVVPAVEDILRVLVEPPDPRDRRPSPYGRERKVPPPPSRTNYLLREIQNSSLGRAGELFVLNFERARLLTAGRDRLASDIEHVAQTRGDHEGFDILSFDPDGAERLIEVKTTSFGQYTPFFVSANELRVSQRGADRYRLYRVFSFRKQPRLFNVPGSLDRSFELSPSEYQARVC